MGHLFRLSKKFIHTFNPYIFLVFSVRLQKYWKAYLQLTLEQHRSELRESSHSRIFFTKSALWYYDPQVAEHIDVKPQVQRAADCTVIADFQHRQEAGAPNRCVVQGSTVFVCPVITFQIN